MQLKSALFISQEVSPYLADSVSSLLGRNVPQALQGKGIEVRSFMPKYARINERRNQLHEVIRLSGLNICIDDTDHPLIIKVATLLPTRMQVYFIDNEDYFHRGGEGIEIYSFPEDNDERIMFFARGVVETVRKLRWVPDVIACTGWVTSLAPLYIRRRYADDPTLQSSKIVYVITSDDVPAQLDNRIVDKLEQDGFAAQDMKSLSSTPQIDALALGRQAIDYCDGVVVSAPGSFDSLAEYAQNQGKAVISISPDDPEYAQKYIEFFESL